MAVLSPARPRLQRASMPPAPQSLAVFGRNAVARAIRGTKWTVAYHQAPDYQESLIVLPADDTASTFVISAIGPYLRLQACRDDTLRNIGGPDSPAHIVSALRSAIALETARKRTPLMAPAAG